MLFPLTKTLIRKDTKRCRAILHYFAATAILARFRCSKLQKTCRARPYCLLPCLGFISTVVVMLCCVLFPLTKTLIRKDTKRCRAILHYSAATAILVGFRCSKLQQTYRARPYCLLPCLGFISTVVVVLYCVLFPLTKTLIRIALN